MPVVCVPHWAYPVASHFLKEFVTLVVVEAQKRKKDRQDSVYVHKKTSLKTERCLSHGFMCYAIQLSFGAAPLCENV